MDFEIIGKITDIETIAAGSGIRERARLQKRYGKGRWRKVKGIAQVRLPNGSMRRFTGMKPMVLAKKSSRLSFLFSTHDANPIC